MISLTGDGTFPVGFNEIVRQAFVNVTAISDSRVTLVAKKRSVQQDSTLETELEIGPGESILGVYRSTYSNEFSGQIRQTRNRPRPKSFNSSNSSKSTSSTSKCSSNKAHRKICKRNSRANLRQRPFRDKFRLRPWHSPSRRQRRPLCLAVLLHSRALCVISPLCPSLDRCWQCKSFLMD